jgi:HEAT repeat protein
MVLGWIRSRDAIVPLLWALKDKDTEARKMAAWALGRIGGAKAKNALKEILSDEDEVVVEYAKEAMQRIRL